MNLKRILTDLKGRARSRRKEFEKVVSSLRKMRPKEAENLISRLDEELFSEIDCLECGNCCRTLGPRIRNRDIQNLASELRMGTRGFINTYLKRDEEGDFIFKRMPCPFLGNSHICSVYPIRPGACVDYPHTNGRQVQSNLGLLIKNSETCPVVYEILNRLSVNNR